MISALLNKQKEPELADGKKSFFKKQTTTTIITKQDETYVDTSNDTVQEQPAEGQEETKQVETVSPPPPACTGDYFRKYISKYTERLSEEQLEYMILEGTTYISGDINNNKT